jgi:hypothetical protein
VCHTLDLRKILRQISIVHVAGVFGLFFLVFLYLFISLGGFQDDLQGLSLVGIEICAGVAITLLIVERALDMEKSRVQVQFASLDRKFLCDSLAKLVVFAYIRLFKGDTGDIYKAFDKINDRRPWELYLSLCDLGSDKMVPLIKDIAVFSAQDFILGIGKDATHPQSQTERSKVIANRFDAYVLDTIAISRNLPDVIDRAIQTSSNVSYKKVLYMMKELAQDHEKAVENPLKTEFDAAERYRVVNQLWVGI